MNVRFNLCFSFVMGLYFGALEATKIAFVDLLGQETIVDTDEREYLLCIPGFDIDDDVVYEFVIDVKRSDTGKKIPSCFINRRDWLKAIESGSSRENWERYGLDFMRRAIARVQVYKKAKQESEEAKNDVYKLVTVINSLKRDEREKLFRAEWTVTPTQLTAALVTLSMSTCADKTIAECAKPATDFVRNRLPSLSGRGSESDWGWGNSYEQRMANMVPSLLAANHMRQVERNAEAQEFRSVLYALGFRDPRQAFLPDASEARVADVEFAALSLPVAAPVGVRPEIWASVRAAWSVQPFSHSQNISLNLSNKNISPSELASIIRAIPQGERSLVQQLDLRGNGLENLPPEMDMLQGLRVLHIEYNQINDLPWRILNAYQRGELEINAEGNPLLRVRLRNRYN